MSLYGTNNEERTDLTKTESRFIRQRSRKLLGSLLLPLRARLWLAVAMIFISTTLRVAGPALIAFAIDWALPRAIEDDFYPLWMIILLYLGAAAFSALMVYYFMILTSKIAQSMLFALRNRMFVHTQKLSVEFHERYTAGRVIARQTSDLESISELLSGGLGELVVGIFFMVFTAGALLILDPISFLVLMAAGIPLAIVTRWFQINTNRGFRAQRVASSTLIQNFVETMTGIRAVKAFRKEGRNEKHFGGLVEKYRLLNARLIQLFGIYDPALILIGNATVAAILLVGGFRVLDGTLGIGVLTAAILYARRFFDPMEQIAIFYNSYQSASAALEKISGVLQEEPSVPDPENPVELKNINGGLVFDRVKFQYNTGDIVLHPFSLDIPGGQTIALVGTTGAGKSTLAKLISRFYDPSEGVVRLDGYDLRDISNVNLRQKVVMVTQEAYLFTGSVAQNIQLGRPGASMDDVVKAAKAVGAHEFILELPYGYETDVNKRGGRVSSGQRQLISFARAFLADPAVLILDEATSSLDIPSEAMVQLGLKTLLAGRTAVIIAHRLSTVSIADRVLVMEHGKIIEDGSPEQLVASGGKFSKLYKSWKDSLV
ncbi:ABC transporter, ATP-binding protein [Candidatus Aquiluna sp. IMCC13023]|uniref:ABC transporter ATP-binding protein n=1 Tax=Candidatus Aquiluna sp. IMCC13023 TaxID=1081644 RepID=UPI00025B28D0|nr:ABC transporter ATP-binding protein [Candidatus Aquiluna sp. IMCC13023]EIC92022.1 ABC transporter, ATP-binding protein [Candidatus Aquiluna sp. IMCC13023]